jgi:hypothetical protein
MKESLFEEFRDFVKREYGYDVVRTRPEDALRFSDVFGLSFIEQQRQNEQAINKKSDFVLFQERRIELLKQLLKDGDNEALSIEKNEIIKKFKEAGILDETGSLSEHYKNNDK